MAGEEPARDRLQACRNVGELRNALDELCGDFGRIVAVTLLCSPETASDGMCMIDFPPDTNAASRCATVLGGRLFGYHSVVLSFPRHPQFSCPRGYPPEAPSCSCRPEQ